MSAASYSPGSWLALTTDRMWLIVDLPADDDRVGELWRAASSASVDETLSILLARGLDHLPSFAVAAQTDDGIRAVVRHPARILRRDAEEEVEVVGPVGGTWSDTISTTAARELRIEAPAAAGSVMLPLGHGVTTAGVLAVDLDRRDVAAADMSSPVAPAGAEAVEPDDLVAEDEASPDEHETATSHSVATRPSDFYGQLLGSTVDRDALLAQIADELDPSDEPAAPLSSAPKGDTAIWVGTADLNEDGPERSEDDDQMATPDRPASPAREPSSQSGVIDGVPWAASAGPPSQSDSTRLGSSSVRNGVAAPAPPAFDAPEAPVHEPASNATASGTAGHTSTVNRPELLNAVDPGPESTPDQRVLAVLCPAEHVTSAYSSTCRVCGATIVDQDATEVVRPPLGTLRLSTGQTVLLDRDVVLGRAPEDRNDDPALRPHLVQLTESAEVSRMHVRISLDGWQPMIRDLGSSNGTTLTLRGSEPRQLRPHEDYPLEPDCEVSLADMVSFTYDVSA